MTLLVFECGAKTLDPVAQAVGEMVREIGLGRISLLFKEHEATADYQSSACSLDESLRLLQAGEVVSVLASGERKNSGFAMIDRPDDLDSLSPSWHGYGERRGKYSPDLIEPFKDLGGLQFVYVALEDTLELETESRELSVDNFPWEHWRLLCAAVRRSDGTWEQREGPAAQSLRRAS